MISVIVPVYNTASYLNECVNSVVNQSYTDFEVILVDDGSTDGSGQICDDWERKDSRVKVIHQVNQGVSAARNHGIEVAKGEYITFVDSDDTISPSYLQDMIGGMMDSGDIDLVVTGCIHHIYDNHIQVFSAKKKEIIQLSAEDGDTFLDNIGLFYGPISKLYVTSIIKENNIIFPEKYSLGEDLLFNFSYLEHVSNILLFPVANYHYRILPLSNLTLYREDRFDIHYHEWHVQVNLLKEKNIWNEKARELFYVKLWAIVYEGVFCIKSPTISYLKHILKIDEMVELRKYKHTFHTKEWIKCLILSKNYLLLYVVRKIRK